MSSPPNKKPKLNPKESKFTIKYKFFSDGDVDDYEYLSLIVDPNEYQNDKQFTELVRREYKKVKQRYSFACLCYTTDNETYKRLIPNEDTKIFASEDIKYFEVGTKLYVKFTPEEEPIEIFGLPLDELGELYGPYEDLFQSNGIQYFGQMGDLECPDFIVTDGTYLEVFSKALLVPSYLIHKGKEEDLQHYENMKAFPVWTKILDLIGEYPFATQVKGSYHPYDRRYKKDPSHRHIIEFKNFHHGEITLKECGFNPDLIYTIE